MIPMNDLFHHVLSSGWNKDYGWNFTALETTKKPLNETWNEKIELDQCTTENLCVQTVVIAILIYLGLILAILIRYKMSFFREAQTRVFICS